MGNKTLISNEKNGDFRDVTSIDTKYGGELKVHTWEADFNNYSKEDRWTVHGNGHVNPHGIYQGVLDMLYSEFPKR